VIAKTALAKVGATYLLTLMGLDGWAGDAAAVTRHRADPVTATAERHSASRSGPGRASIPRSRARIMGTKVTRTSYAKTSASS